MKTHGGKCKNRHRMRCSEGKLGCGRRFTLRKHPLKYKRDPKCPHCGSIHVRDVEKERRAEQDRRLAAGKLCRCYAYPFPHNAGSLRFCKEHPLMVQGVEPTEDEEYEYEGCLRTPRSGGY